MDPRTDDYVGRAINLLASVSASTALVSGPRVQELDLDTFRVEFRIRYDDASMISVSLLLASSGDGAMPVEYSFHYQSAESTLISRYDNTPRHPNLPDFPDHKHIGPDNRVEGYRQPSVRQVRAEIERHLSRRPHHAE